MKFDKKYVHCVWDESLVGKLCVFADDIPCLRKHVEQCVDDYIGALQEPPASACDLDVSPEDLVFPFCMSDGTHYKFVYYDPNYMNKLAFENGKQIQYLHCNEWFDMDNPVWNDTTTYRVKPDKPEPEYRPYKDIDSFIYEYRNMCHIFGEPLVIWVKDINQDIMLMCDGLDRTDNTVRIEGEWWTMAQLLKGYTYLDGTPLGVKE